MGSLYGKWRIIRQVLRSRNSMLVTYGKDGFRFDCLNDSMMFDQLYENVVKFVGSWVSNWHWLNSVDDEAD